ncbi:MAG: hypothetical protein SAJ72_20720 [Jaaginema sp. PMC 1080.18]|nr:hypothetical protein [Jaaginema sp. PMC 1080.18]MEC4866383.1 hypothetical protein [Jaaginema sp. PMC 1078.18]
MSLSQQQLTEYGLRLAQPVPECKKFGNGWVARCRFRLTDHEIMVLDDQAFNHQVGVELEEKSFERITDNNSYEVRATATKPGEVASWSWKRRDYYFDLRDNIEITIERSMTRHLTLNRDWGRGTQGLFIQPNLELKSAVEYLIVKEEESFNAGGQYFNWRVFRGDPDDLDKVFDWHVKNIGSHYHSKTVNPYYVNAIDLNPDRDPSYCSRGTEEGSTIYGVSCRFDNYSETTAWTKIKQITFQGNPVRARLATLQLGNERMPWTVVGPRWKDYIVKCDFPDDPELRPIHKKGIKKTFLRPTTDNIIGLPDGEEYDQEVYLPKIIKSNGEDHEIPDSKISARLDSVNFYYCGCRDGEIECEDSEGNACCVDCCKIGEFVLDIFGH